MSLRWVDCEFCAVSHHGPTFEETKLEGPTVLVAPRLCIYEVGLGSSTSTCSFHSFHSVRFDLEQPQASVSSQATHELHKRCAHITSIYAPIRRRTCLEGDWMVPAPSAHFGVLQPIFMRAVVGSKSHIENLSWCVSVSAVRSRGHGRCLRGGSTDPGPYAITSRQSR